jgi:hypothetical protein
VKFFKSKRNQKVAVIFSMLAAVGIAVAAHFDLNCSACGNSTLDRGAESARFLSLFSGSPNVSRRDTVTLTGGDGTQGKYVLVSKTASVKWTCIQDCGPGDEFEAFIPIERDPVTNEPINPAGGGWSGGLLDILRALWNFLTVIVTVGEIE